MILSILAQYVLYSKTKDLQNEVLLELGLHLKFPRLPPLDVRLLHTRSEPVCSGICLPTKSVLRKKVNSDHVKSTASNISD